jgi:MFS family permease
MAVVTAVDTQLPAPSLFSRSLRATSTGAIALVSLIAFEALAVTTAMPTVARELGGVSLYALAFSAALATSVVGMVAAGAVSDARGPARPLLWGVALFAAGLVVCGAAPAMSVVVAGRLLQGLGSGLASVSLYVVVARLYPPSLHPRVFAAFAGAWVVPAIVGPAIAGVIVEQLGWRWVFLGVPLLAVLASTLLWPAMAGIGAAEADEGTAEDGDGGSATADAGVDALSDPRTAIRWAVLAAGAAVALQAAARIDGALVAPAVAAALAVLVVAARRLLPAGALRAARGLPAVVLLRGLVSGAFAGTEVFLPLLLVREHGLSSSTAGLVLTVGALTWSAGSWFQGRASSAGTRVRIVRTGMALTTAGVAAQGVLLLLDVPAAFAIGAWAVTGLGIGLAYPTFAVLALELSEPGRQGAGSAALQLSEALLSATVLALGGIAFGALVAVDATAAYLAAFALAAASAGVGLAVAGRVRALGG